MTAIIKGKKFFKFGWDDVDALLYIAFDEVASYKRMWEI